jgi:hypothetical protein
LKSFVNQVYQGTEVIDFSQFAESIFNASNYERDFIEYDDRAL